MAERDSKRIARQWNREIDDETLRLAAAQRGDGAWRTVVWAALWVLWIGVVFAMLGVLQPLK